MSNNDRAVQFAPFASLRGHYGMIQKEEKITLPRRELGEDECIMLSQKLLSIKKGDMLKLTYYNTDHYETVSGVCQRIDLLMHTVSVAGKIICTDDICMIEN